MNIALMVENLTTTYETRDPYKLCRYLNIHVRFSDLKNIKGIYKKIDNRQFITVNENLSPFAKERIIAHELGHALIHSDSDTIMMKDIFMFPKHNKFEVEANIFAANLLMSDDYIGRYEPENEFDVFLHNELLYYIKF